MINVFVEYCRFTLGLALIIKWTKMSRNTRLFFRGWEGDVELDLFCMLLFFYSSGKKKPKLNIYGTLIH
jgi:hypothetical protein